MRIFIRECFIFLNTNTLLYSDRMKNDATPRGRRALEEQTENEYTTMESEEHLQEAIQHLCRVDKSAE